MDARSAPTCLLGHNWVIAHGNLSRLPMALLHQRQPVYSQA